MGLHRAGALIPCPRVGLASGRATGAAAERHAGRMCIWACRRVGSESPLLVFCATGRRISGRRREGAGEGVR